MEDSLLRKVNVVSQLQFKLILPGCIPIRFQEIISLLSLEVKIQTKQAQVSELLINQLLLLHLIQHLSLQDEFQLFIILSIIYPIALLYFRGELQEWNSQILSITCKSPLLLLLEEVVNEFSIMRNYEEQVLR